MKTLAAALFGLLVLLLAVETDAHPGNGLVAAPDGTLYFADVARTTIWKLDPAGTLTPLQRDRWTHALCLAPDGVLYYEREEQRDGMFPCSLWKVTPEGKHEEVIPAQPDRRDFGGAAFVVDSDRNVYYPHTFRDAEQNWRTHIMRRTPRGAVEVFTGLGDGPLYRDGGPATATIRIVTAMAIDATGTIYFTDRDHIRTVETRGESAGRVSTLASGLIDTTPRDSPHRSGPPTTVNRLYGLAVGQDGDGDGDVLTAYQAGRRVIRVTEGGEREVVHRSDRDWSPIGLTLSGETIYVLEIADDSITKLRVLRIEPEGDADILVTLE